MAAKGRDLFYDSDYHVWFWRKRHYWRIRFGVDVRIVDDE